MKTKQLRNGSLYYNDETDRVERVLGKVNCQRVWTSWHERGAHATRTNRLRLASQTEVAEYLDERELAHASGRGEVNPAIPALGLPL